MIDVEHRRKREVDAAGPKFGGQHKARRLEAALSIHARGDVGHRRHLCEAGAKALHAPALMIDADKDARTHRMNLLAQRSELRWIPVIS